MIYHRIVHRTVIDKGWSGDQKYCVVTNDGRKYLLRIAAPERADRTKAAFFRMQQIYDLGISMPQPLEMGTCHEGIYTIQSWIEGADAETVIPNLPEPVQHTLGLDAGKMLKVIHTLPVPASDTTWDTKFNAKIDRKIAMYESCPLRYERDELILNYLADYRHLLAGRPQTYQHGDYHIGNMMVDSEGKLVVIDFDRDDIGDPWEEFNRIVWCAQAAPEFARGMVEGYFDGDVPEDFWRLLLLYICSNTLSSLPWAVPYGETQIKVMTNQWADILSWFDDFDCIVPKWYRKET